MSFMRLEFVFSDTALFENFASKSATICENSQTSEIVSADQYDDLLRSENLRVACSLNCGFVAVGHGQTITVSRKPDLPGVESSQEYVRLISVSANVSALIAIDVASTRRSAASEQFLVAGCDSGLVSFYSLREPKRVFDLKGISEQAVKSMHFYELEDGEQALGILFDNILVSIDSLSLLTICNISENSEFETNMLNLHIWQLPNDFEGIRDFGCVGPLSVSTFSALLALSPRFSFRDDWNPRRFSQATFVAVGSSPFCSFFLTPHEQEIHPVQINDVVQQVAERILPQKAYNISSAMASWAFSSMRGSPSVPKLPESVAVALMTSLSDAGRFGESLFVSPDKKLVAVTDSLARIVLIDVASQSLIRTWKGYRNAQCGWIQAKDDWKALFLVIYVPRRGVIEAWTMCQGPMVASVNVGKGRLIAPRGGLLGFKQDSISLHFDAIYFVEFTGTIYRISLPFRAALCDDSSVHFHDATLVKDVQFTVDHADESTSSSLLFDQLCSILSQFKTMESLSFALEFLLMSDCLDAKVKSHLVETCRIHAATLKGDSELDLVTRHFALRCVGYHQLLDVHALLSKMNDCDNSIPSSSTTSTQDVLSLLRFKDVYCLNNFAVDLDANCKARMNARKPPRDVSASFTCPNVSFLFRLVDWSKIPLHKDRSGFVQLCLKADASNDRLHRLGQFLFRPFLLGCDAKILKQQILPQFKFSCETLLRLFACTWLHCTHSFTILPCSAFHVLLQLFTDCSPRDALFHAAVNAMEEDVLCCCNIAEAYSFSVVVRAVLICLSENHNDTDDSSDLAVACADLSVPLDAKRAVADLDEEWVHVKPVLQRWDLLVANLQLLLNIDTMLCLRCMDDHLCLKRAFADYGRWLFMRLLGKFVLCADVEPSDVIPLFAQPVDGELRDDRTDCVTWESLFIRVKSQLPLSTTIDGLFASCVVEFCACASHGSLNVHRLNRMVAFTKDISNTVLQHAVALHLWSSCLERRFQKLCYQLEREGSSAASVDFCGREFEPSDESSVLSDFVAAVEVLLCLLADAASTFEQHTAPLFVFEDFLECFFAEFNFQQLCDTSLMDELLRNKCTNYHLVKHHWHLAVAVRLFVEQSGRQAVKPFALFDAKGKNAFFKSLHSYPLLPMAAVDSSTVLLRKSFCQQTLSCFVETLDSSEKFATPSEESMSKLRECFPMQKLKLLLNLANEWEIDGDFLYRHLICCLYLSGFDVIAEMFVRFVENKLLLACELLIVAGQRIQALVSKRSVEVDAILSPTVATWLKTADIGQLVSTNFSCASIVKILCFVDSILPPDISERAIVEKLIDVAGHLQK